MHTAHKHRWFNVLLPMMASAGLLVFLLLLLTAHEVYALESGAKYARTIAAQSSPPESGESWAEIAKLLADDGEADD